MRISDRSSDVCSSDLSSEPFEVRRQASQSWRRSRRCRQEEVSKVGQSPDLKPKLRIQPCPVVASRKSVRFFPIPRSRSEEHTSELQSLMRISYAVFCLKKKTTITQNHKNCKKQQI